MGDEVFPCRMKVRPVAIFAGSLPPGVPPPPAAGGDRSLQRLRIGAAGDPGEVALTGRHRPRPGPDPATPGPPRSSPERGGRRPRPDDDRGALLREGYRPVRYHNR